MTMSERIYDVVVVGSGPAGLTAGIYATRGAASTLILGGSAWGGQLMLTSLVENYPGFPQGIQGPALMEAMKIQAVRLGAEFKPQDVMKINLRTCPFEIYSQVGKYLARSVIITTGAVTLWLEAPGVKEFIGRGVSSCATCDAPFFKDKKVVVVGGGDTAMEEALYLAKFASAITIIHRRDQFRASKVMQEKVLGNSKIKVVWNTEVTAVRGDQSVKNVSLKNTQTGETSELAVDGVFIAIGHQPASDLVKGQLDLDEAGYVKPQFHCGTKIPGVFVAGEVIDRDFKQIVVEAGSGCIAAMEALKYLEAQKQG